MEVLNWRNSVLLQQPAPAQKGLLEEFTVAKVTFWWPLADCLVRSEPFYPMPVLLLDDWCSCFIPSRRTGLEAIMETYAFWRPPVRTLTFEDFTTMQKQQGECTKDVQSRRGEWRTVTCSVSPGDHAELLMTMKGHREGGWQLGDIGQAVHYKEQCSCLTSLVSPELKHGVGRSAAWDKPVHMNGMDWVKHKDRQRQWSSMSNALIIIYS